MPNEHPLPPVVVVVEHCVIALPVSLGEALDKLTILDIKKQRIRDGERLAYVRDEYDALMVVLEAQVAQFRFYYACLLDMNLQIWDDQDRFRAAALSATERAALCLKIITDNDARFRIKHKINTLSMSKFREQKSYTPKTALVQTHLGLGDNLTAVGMVRHFAQQYDKVIVAARQHNVANVAALYSDDPSIEVVRVDQPRRYLLQQQRVPNLTILACGTWHPSRKFASKVPQIPFDWYRQLNVSPRTFWTHFHINSAAIPQLPAPAQPYVFVHNTSSQGEMFNMDQPALQSLVAGRFVVNPCLNAYPKTSTCHADAEQYIAKPLLAYYELMANADVVVLSNSSFLCLGFHIPYREHTQCYYVSHTTDFTYLYQEPNAPPKTLQRTPFKKLTDVAVLDKRR